MHQTSGYTLIGHHGCNEEYCESIKADNFRRSEGPAHNRWLGSGVYFFGAGISDPLVDAQNWAIAAAWDNERKDFAYKTFAVLKAEIVAERRLDITTDEGKKIVIDARKKLIQRYSKSERGNYRDAELLKFLVSFMKFDVLIYDFYIKFTEERRLRIESNMPNVRVICVANPIASIDKSKIEVIKTGLIRN